jgi:beta-phosphoglucomutase-like phosphatase (HAD superfamily)
MSGQQPRIISAVIYDLDGTLLDTERLAKDAFNNIVRSVKASSGESGSTSKGRNDEWTWADHGRIIGTKKEFWSALVISEYGLEGLIDCEYGLEGLVCDLKTMYELRKY